MSEKIYDDNRSAEGESVAKLVYRTRGDTSPQDKERVYFTCHPDDFAAYFDTICEEIFATQNCAIYYKEDPASDWSDEEMELELNRMQLFVIPVTSRFLYQDNSARNAEFVFAIDHHIPVLPLMQESGLDTEFNIICGDLQYLDKAASDIDPTVLPYEKKLENFLSSVLLGDELAVQVRDAFDAYIFLSYRKKDRKYAQDLMRLIHKNDFCRDIAIWYDEFLVPGETFNQAIKDAMEKSNLFTFVVTPNLLEPGNYVMTTEYPVAKEENKPILPAEMEGTDRDLLRENFKDIPDPTDAYDGNALTDALLERVRSLDIKENNSDPIHQFFIGMAYLGGIDVEVDNERAVSLITTAAEADLPEAMRKLSEMYKNGEGVERNYEMSVRWLEKLAEYWEKQFADSGSREDGREYFAVLWDLGDHQKMNALAEDLFAQFGGDENHRFMADSYAFLSMESRADGNLDEAAEWCGKALTIYEEIGQNHLPIGASFDIAWCYMHLAEINGMEGNLTESKECYLKAVELIRNNEINIARDVLFNCYIGLGKNCYMEDNMPEAKQWWQKSMELSKALCREEGSRHLSKLADSYDKLGDISKDEGAFTEAEEWYNKALAEREEIFRETGSRGDLWSSYYRLGNIRREEGDLEDAKKWCRKALKLEETFYRETNGLDSLEQMSHTYTAWGDICQEEYDFGEAEKWYRKAMELLGTMAVRTNNSMQVLREMVNICNKILGLNHVDENLYKKKEWERNYLELYEEICRKTYSKEDDRRNLIVAYCKMGDIIREEGYFSEAREWYRKGLVLIEELYRKTGMPDDRLNLSAFYERYANLSQMEGNLEEAKEWYYKDRELCEERCREEGDAEAYDRLAILDYTIGYTYSEDINVPMLEEAESIWEQLAQLFPQESRYSQNAQTVHDILTEFGEEK